MRTNKIDDATKILLMAGGIIITCIIIAIGMSIARSAKKLGENINIQISDLDNDISSRELMAFNGEIVGGSEVVNLIKNKLGDYDFPSISPLYIEVITINGGISHSNIYQDNTYISKIRNFAEDDYYIKPTGKFLGKVIKNENGIIIGITFTQE